MCGQTFSGAKDLMAHVLTHKEKTFSCNHCDENFWEKTFLDTNKLTHKTKGDKENRINISSNINTISKAGRISKHNRFYNFNEAKIEVKNSTKVEKENKPTNKMKNDGNTSKTNKIGHKTYNFRTFEANDKTIVDKAR